MYDSQKTKLTCLSDTNTSRLTHAESSKSVRGRATLEVEIYIFIFNHLLGHILSKKKYSLIIILVQNNGAQVHYLIHVLLKGARTDFAI